MTANSSPPLVVLVVEDDALTRFDLIETLEDNGYEALAAKTADEAIVILESRIDITAVFSDIEMPGTMDGIGLIKYVRARFSLIALILTSGRVAPDESTLPSGTLFISKPRQPSDMARVYRCINDRKSRSAAQ